MTLDHKGFLYLATIRRTMPDLQFTKRHERRLEKAKIPIRKAHIDYM